MDVWDEQKREKLVAAMEQKMVRVLRAAQRLRGINLPTAAEDERVDAHPERPRGKATWKIG